MSFYSTGACMWVCQRWISRTETLSGAGVAERLRVRCCLVLEPTLSAPMADPVDTPSKAAPVGTPLPPKATQVDGQGDAPPKAATGPGLYSEISQIFCTRISMVVLTDCWWLFSPWWFCRSSVQVSPWWF